MKTIFDAEVTERLIQRIEKLSPESQAKWGTMNVAQMLAHVNVSYELVYTDKHPKPNAFMRFIIKALAKKTVVGDKPYKQNSRTAPNFVIADERDFQAEKERLIEYSWKTQKLGAAHFDGKESNSFGKLTVKEWHNLFHKHLDHHLRQFGV